jgi:hypothetical protein
MSGSRPSSPLPPGLRQRLLPTPPELVPSGYADTLRVFCATIPEIETGYVCAVEQASEDAEPVQRLSFCVELAAPVDTVDDSRDVTMAIAVKLGDSHPELMRELGCGVLADRAVPAWQELALCVFAR